MWFQLQNEVVVVESRVARPHLADVGGVLESSR